MPVDLFVLSEFRNDPLVILKLYLELKKLIKKSEISIIVAVPNINSVSYFTNILKFKNIGNLKYWIFFVMWVVDAYLEEYNKGLNLTCEFLSGDVM